MIETPAYGTMKYTLMPSQGGGYTIQRRVWVEGTSCVYDEEDKDFVTLDGRWSVVETLGRFNTREEAREFMVAHTSSEEQA